MLEQTLKYLAARGYSIESRYDPIINAIIIRLEKGGHQLIRRVQFFELSSSAYSFEFAMNQILKGMDYRFEQEKGETDA